MGPFTTTSRIADVLQVWTTAVNILSIREQAT